MHTKPTEKKLYRSVIRDFFAYTAAPYNTTKEDIQELSTWNRLKRMIWLFGFISLVTGVIAILIEGIIQAAGYHPQNPFADQIPALIFFVGVLGAPIYEELVFRGWLRLTKSRWSIAICFALFGSLVSLILGSLNLISWILPASILLGVLSIASIVNRDKTVDFFNTHFRILYYGSLVLFAAAHLSNYPDISRYWYLAPLVVIPYLIGAIALSYIRMKFGLFFSIIFHFTNNLLSFAAGSLVLSDTASSSIPIFIVELCFWVIGLGALWQYKTYKQTTIFPDEDDAKTANAWVIVLMLLPLCIAAGYGAKSGVDYAILAYNNNKDIVNNTTKYESHICITPQNNTENFYKYATSQEFRTKVTQVQFNEFVQKHNASLISCPPEFANKILEDQQKPTDKYLYDSKSNTTTLKTADKDVILRSVFRFDSKQALFTGGYSSIQIGDDTIGE
jgi:uncharacterized protein